MISLLEKKLIKYVCQNCNKIFDYGNDKCTFCNQPIYPLSNYSSANDILYPPVAAIDILYSLFDIKELADKKQKDIINNIINEIKAKYSLIKDYSSILNLFTDYCNKMNQIKDNISCNEISRKVVSEHLKIPIEEVDNICFDIIKKDNFVSLYNTIIILSASLIEIIFRKYMQNVLIKKTNYIIAQNLLDLNKSRTIEGYISILNAFFENKLESEFKEVDVQFFNKWHSLREQRNKIIHANSLYISQKRAKEVINLATISIDIFAKLNNKL